MPYYKSIVKCLLAAAAAAVLWVGCGGSESTDDRVSSGLSFSTVDSAIGVLAGSFAGPDGHTVYFEARRGDALPDEERISDPTLPVYEVDVRFYDSAGDNFILRAGGHTVRDPAWVYQREEVDVDLRRRDFATVRIAADALANTELLIGLEAERGALIQIARFVTSDEWVDSLGHDGSAPREVDPGDREEAVDPHQDTQSERGSIGRLVLAQHRPANRQNYTHRINIRKGPIDAGGIDVGIADHSATASTVLDSSSAQVRYFETCNHGRCASVLPSSCSRSWQNRGSTLPINSICCRDGQRSCGDNHCGIACCSTQYGIRDGRHVCNDDSRLQRDIMNNNGAGFCAEYCGDQSVAMRAPSCF